MVTSSTCAPARTRPATTSGVRLAVDLKHEYPTDVKIELSHGGTTVVLDDHTGKVRGVFDLDFTVDDRSRTLAAFNGINPNGAWTVRIIDWYSGSTGVVRNLVLFVQ